MKKYDKMSQYVKNKDIIAKKQNNTEKENNRTKETAEPELLIETDNLIISIRSKKSSVSLQNEHFYARTTNKKMKELNVDLRDITNYFIQLFLRTGKRYSCTQTKLGKLISVLAFRYAINDEKLFNEVIFKYPPHCGTLIKTLTFIPKDVYLRDIEKENFDTPNPITDCVLDDIEIPFEYKTSEDFPSSVELEIEDVFRNFGSYSGDDLAKQLNPIVDEIVNQSDNEIDLSKLKSLDINSFSINTCNDNIIKYIYR